jgi:hypothetical protein
LPSPPFLGVSLHNANPLSALAQPPLHTSKNLS